jgi:type IV pilus assembly protein PilF
MRWLSLGVCLLLSACSGVQVDDSAPPTGASISRISRTGGLNLGLAESYLQANDLENAFDRTQRVLKTDPNSAEAHAMLGLIYGRTGESEKAENSFGRALKLAPDKGAVLNAYGTWLCQQRRFTEAEIQLDKALLDPRAPGPQILYNAGKCAQQAGWREKAEKHLRRALASAPNDPQILFALAEVELSLGKTLEARAFIQRREAMGADANVLALAAAIEDAAGDASAAARYRQKLNQNIPGHNSPDAGEGRQ